MKTLNEKLSNDLNNKNSLTEVLSAGAILTNKNKDNDSIVESQENKDIQSQSDKD